MTAIEHNVLGLIRISLGWIFGWAFVDKVWGLGFATESGKAWIDGISPTAGFLKFGAHGPLASFYQGMAGSALVEWLFMLGLFGIGLAFLLGIMVRPAAIGGVLLMILLYTAAMPPKQNPVVDQHVIYALLFVVFSLLPVGEWLGLGRWWARLPLVQRMPWLK